MVASIRRSLGQDMGLGDLGMTNSKPVITSLVMYWIFLVDLIFISRDKDLCHAQTRPTWFELAAGYKSWPLALNLHSGVLSVGQHHGQGSLLPVDPLFHFLQCHNGLVSSRNGHVCLYLSASRGGSGYSKWEGSQYLHPQSLASRALSQQSRL